MFISTAARASDNSRLTRFGSRRPTRRGKLGKSMAPTTKMTTEMTAIDFPQMQTLDFLDKQNLENKTDFWSWLMDAYGMAHGPLAYELIDDALVVQGQTIPLPPVRGLPVKYQDLDQLPVMVSLKELKQLFNDLLRFKTFERQPMEQVKPLETVKQLPEREPVRELANVQPGRYNPLEIGRRDMEPFTGPSFGSPMGPVGGYPGGGSIVGPDHPMFNNPYPGYPPNLGPPRFNDMQVPPGARFDPVSPFGNPQRPSRMGRGMPFTGEPNPDHFAPPGGYDPYI